MIGGNIPGATRVLSVADLRPRRGDGICPGPLACRRHAAVFLSGAAGAVRLRQRTHGEPDHERYRCPVRPHPRRFPAGRRVRYAGTGRHRPLRPFRIGQDHAAALPRRPGTGAGRLSGSQRRDLAGRQQGHLPAHPPPPSRLRVPGGQPVPAPERAPQPGIRLEAHPGNTKTGAASTRRWSWSASANCSTATRRAVRRRAPARGHRPRAAGPARACC